MKEQIQLKDFLGYQFLADVAYAPDGKCAAYIAAQCDEKNNGYTYSLYVWDGENHKKLETLNHPITFLWEDDSTLLFGDIRDAADQAAVERGEERSAFYLASVAGGAAKKAFSLPLKVSAIKKAAEDTYVLIAKYDLNYSHMYLLSDAEREDLLAEKKAMKDYEIVDELPFYGNGLGYVNKLRNKLFIFHPSTGELIPVSETYMNVSGFELDGDKVYYYGETYEQVLTNHDAIYCCDLATGESELVLPGGTYLVYSVTKWDDQILVVASDMVARGFNENPKFFLLNQAEKALDLFCDYDDSTYHSVNSDCRLGAGRYVKAYEGKYYFMTSIENRCSVYSLDKEGKVSPVVDVEGSVDCYDIANGTMLLCGMYDLRLQELYTCPVEGGELTRVSDHNEAFYQAKDVRPLESCTIQGGEYTLYGWVMKPRNYDETKKYPAILQIHGGPKVSYGQVYNHEMQMFANDGYFVFYMNPRGSDGRGSEFLEMRGRYGTIDYEDIMNFTEAVVKAYPAIDENRLGVAGGSYGGFMTNWIIGHTDRFAAACSQRSIANMIAHVGTSDIGYSFTVDQQQADLWDEGGAEILWDRSPLKYANNCITPTLFIHSDEDYRCPLADGMEMFGALRRHGVDTRLVIFHGENHELSRSGKPVHRVKRLDEMKKWFDKYLK